MKHQLFIPKVFSTSTPTSRPTNEPEFDDSLPSPASTVASVTRELEDTLQTLDLHTAMRGQYVVKPQVNFTILSHFVYQLEVFLCLLIVQQVLQNLRFLSNKAFVLKQN